MEFKLIKCHILIFLLIFIAKTTFSKTSLCPDVSICTCQQTRSNYNYYIKCNSVSNINFDVIYQLLETHSYWIISKLTLSTCYISNLPTNMFGNSTILEFTSSCPLVTVHSGTLSNLKYLSKVFLENTRFEAIPGDIQQMKQLQSLLLTKHQVTSLRNELWNLTSLSYLGIKNGLLSFITENSFGYCLNLNYVDLSYNKLQTLPPNFLNLLKNLKSIILNGNQLQTVDGLFNNINPQEISLYRNHLTSIENIFRDNMFNVTAVKLGRNPLKLINSSVFEKTIVNVQVLDLSNCELHALSPTLFRNLRSLQKLFLESNSLTMIPEGFFHHLRNLTNIDLKDNSITHMANVFFDNPQLQVLSLSNNQLSNLDNIFSELPQLSKLYLGMNAIRELHKKYFSGCYNLQVIDLSDNPIMILDSNSFENLISLQVLNLSRSEISTLNNSVQNLPELVELHADGCNIRELRKGELVKLPKLSNLTLRRNVIEDVEGAFVDLPKLKVLYLGGYFPTLTRDSLPSVLQLTSISLEGNIACDCRLMWLVEWLKGQNTSSVVGSSICWSPQRLLLKPLSLLTVNDLLDCAPSCSCDCIPRGHESYSSMNCSGQNLTSIPERLPDRVGEIFLDNNELNDISNLDLKSLDFLKILDLSNNSLVKLTNSPLKTIEILKLRGNKLTRLAPSIFELRNLSALTLSQNPWICDCNVIEMKNWMLKLGIRVVTDMNDIRCGNAKSNDGFRNAAITSLDDSLLCNKVSNINLDYRVIGVLLTIIIMVLVITVFVYYYGTTVKAILYWKGLTCIKSAKDDEDRDYDAAILHHRLDSHFVKNVLRTGLQKENYTICVPDETQNMDLEALTASCKRIIIVVTKEYLQDPQCIAVFEFMFAQRCQMGSERIIVIRLGNIVRLTEAEPTIKSALASKICINYESKFFWQKLMYLMPKKTHTMKKHENDTTDDDLISA